MTCSVAGKVLEQSRWAGQTEDSDEHVVIMTADDGRRRVRGCRTGKQFGEDSHEKDLLSTLR